MARIDPSWIGKVMTVEGLIPAADLGITTPHEHLRVQEWDQHAPNFYPILYSELVQFVQAGGRSLVEASPIGLPRDVLLIRRLAHEAGVQVVVSTGYFKFGWRPAGLERVTVEEMSEAVIGEVVAGIDDTGIHPGLLKVAVSHPIAGSDERVLAAMARAQRQTGAGLSVHLDVFVPAAEYRQVVHILESEGADLSHVSLDHFVARPDWLELYLELAGHGCFIEFDLWGHDRWPLLKDIMHTDVEVQISSVKGVIDHGLLRQILLAQDICNQYQLTVNGGAGYGHLLRTVVPRLRHYGVSDTEIQTMIVENPKRLLAFRAAQ